MKTIYAILVMFLLSSSIHAFAHDPNDFITEELLSSPLRLKSGSSETLSLDRAYYLNNLVIHAEGVVQDTMFEVRVNGVVKGTIYAPGVDPIYVVTIKDVSQKIEFKHLSGADARITKVQLVRTKKGGRPGGVPIALPTRNELSKIASTAVSLSNDLDKILPTEDFRDHILPVKVAAGQLWAIASARGDISKMAYEKLTALYLHMVVSTPFVEKLLHDNGTFELAVEFLTLKEEIHSKMQ